jgi:hypothetical protein
MSNASVRSWHEATGFERGTYATAIEGTADMRPRVPYDCRYPTAVREGTPADRPPPSMNCNGDDGRRHLDRAIDAISERRLVDPLRLSILRGLSATPPCDPQPAALRFFSGGREGAKARNGCLRSPSARPNRAFWQHRSQLAVPYSRRRALPS